jgi:hypothetical protein
MELITIEEQEQALFPSVVDWNPARLAAQLPALDTEEREQVLVPTVDSLQLPALSLSDAAAGNDGDGAPGVCRDGDG